MIVVPRCSHDDGVFADLYCVCDVMWCVVEVFSELMFDVK